MSNLVTISSFGWRLGNQLFQYATAYSYCLEKNKQIVLNTKYKNEHLFQCFDITNVMFEDISLNNIFREHNFNYNSSLFKKNYNSLSGYFQSEKYFLSKKQQILTQLKFKENNFKNNYSESCFIHVRRGDYLKYPNIHPLCGNEYYDSAINFTKNKLGSSTKFIVFSDEIDACKKEYSCFNQNNIFFENNLNSYQTLQAMSGCIGAIIANSSYSWWGAWLGEKQITIAPKKWFGKDGPKETQDIYCKDWIVI